MKRKGTTFIEIVVAIAIFLIAILPIAYLTLNSLRVMKRSSEIEEGARVATTVINYIKSQGYDSIIDNEGILDPTNIPSIDPASLTYTLKLDETNRSSYILDLDNGSDFEEDFLDGSSGRSAASVTAANSLFLINSLGISSETITVVVHIATSDLKVADTDFSTKTSYINPISNTSGSGVIIGTGGLIETPIIYGNVSITYETLSDTSNDLSELIKNYNQNFVITPLENFATSP